MNVVFEWDNEKAERNAFKHGINFKTAAFAFDDPFAFMVDDPKHSTREHRQWLIGDSGSGVLVIVFTLRPPRRAIRIISARRANRKERKIYEESKRV
ncbi:MAG: BrnT family toxin [Elusimicrobia bacterium]|nr:BrnT family toxin [Elusimicrobiota bacterium]